MSTLIGISGKIGCGKSTLGNMLAERLKFPVMSFGGLLKDEVSRVFGFPREWCDSPEGKRRKVHVSEEAVKAGAPLVATVRQLLQYWGTDVCRAKDQDYWVKGMAKRLTLSQALREKAEHPTGTIIDDVRFPNEARMVLRGGGILVRLDPYPGWAAGEHAAHASETALDDWDEWTMRVAPLIGELETVADCLVEIVQIESLIAEQAECVLGHLPQELRNNKVTLKRYGSYRFWDGKDT